MVSKGHQASNRLHIRDRASGQMFLIDTGAGISLVPAVDRVKRKPSELKLFAANDTRIDTFGESLRELDLGFETANSMEFLYRRSPIFYHWRRLALALRATCKFKTTTSRRFYYQVILSRLKNQSQCIRLMRSILLLSFPKYLQNFRK